MAGRRWAFRMRFVFVARPALALRLDMQAQEVFVTSAKFAHGASGAAFGDRVRARLDRAQDRLGLRPRFVRRQTAMLADADAARAPILAILRHIDFAPRGEGRDAKTGERVIPKEIPVLAGGTLQRVHRSFW